MISFEEQQCCYEERNIYVSALAREMQVYEIKKHWGKLVQKIRDKEELTRLDIDKMNDLIAKAEK